MTSQLAGQLQYVLLLSVIDGALLSWFALRWYRSSVRRMMAARGGPAVVDSHAPRTRALLAHPAGHEGSTEAAAAAGPSLHLALFDAEPRGVHARDIGSRFASRRAHARQRLVVAYVAGAAVWSATRTIADLTPGTGSPYAVVWLAIWWMHTWLVVPSLMLLLALTLRESMRAALAYLSIGAGAIALLTLAGQVMRGSFNTAPATNVYYAFQGLLQLASLPAPILLVTGFRRVRAVMPLALAGVAVFGVTSLLFHELLVLAFNARGLRSALLSLSAASSTVAAYYGLFMVAALPAGWLAWQLLRRIAAAFEGRHFGDMQLIVDCWWAVLTVGESAVLAVQYGGWAIPLGAVMFVLYRGTVAAVLRAWRLWLPSGAPTETAAEGNPEPLRLTLLRVFGYQRRTEALFDRVGRQWRFFGPVQLIAGTDLALRTTDPGDMLAFVQGQLASRYVRHAGEIPTRIAGLDAAADADGRFRVNELYCHDDTWRPTLQALLDVSDRVLADFRGFREHHAGCRFELEQLLDRVAGGHVVIVYDQKTDLALLGGILAEAWRALPGPDRPSRGPALVRVEHHSEAAVRLLVRCLIDEAGPGRIVDAATLTLGAPAGHRWSVST